MDRKTRATGASVLIALGGLLAALLFLASPAGADESSQRSGEAVAVDNSTASGGCFAAHGSVCSGSGVAIDGSTSSGDAVAVGGSVASGCSVAVDTSTASGGECGEAAKGHRQPPPPPKVHRVQRDVGVETETAGVAVATETTELAFTGSSTGPLAAAGFAALALGSLMVFVGSERRRSAHSS